MKSTKKEIDAGWNDPPKFSYEESLEYSKSPKRNVLNKRVAFPLHSTSNSSLPRIDPTATPIFNVNLPPPPSSSNVTDTKNDSKNSAELASDEISKLKIDGASSTSPSRCNTSEEKDDETTLNTILTNLNIVMETKRELLQSNNKFELIKKKFEIMEDSWRKNKLIPEVKEKLLSLSEVLKDGNKEDANKIHVTLMVDHPKLCSEFISAFRQLINIESTS